jgi:HTH-type transcriptional regulator/antitoxin HigA
MSRTPGAPRAVRKTSTAPIEHPIRTKREYERFVEEIDALVDANPREGSAAYDRLELLALLVEAYEDEHESWGNDPPSPQSIVRFMAEQQGVTPGELAQLMGGRSRLSDFYNGNRELSRGQIKAVRERLHIPADLLIA